VFAQRTQISARTKFLQSPNKENKVRKRLFIGLTITYFWIAAAFVVKVFMLLVLKPGSRIATRFPRSTVTVVLCSALVLIIQVKLTGAVEPGFLLAMLSVALLCCACMGAAMYKPKEKPPRRQHYQPPRQIDYCEPVSTH
jgi:hypothetical protein